MLATPSTVLFSFSMPLTVLICALDLRGQLGVVHGTGGVLVSGSCATSSVRNWFSHIRRRGGLARLGIGGGGVVNAGNHLRLTFWYVLIGPSCSVSSSRDLAVFMTSTLFW